MGSSVATNVPLWWPMRMVGTLALGGAGVCGQSQHLPLNFAMKSKTGLSEEARPARRKMEAQHKLSASVSPSQGGQLEGAGWAAGGVGSGEQASKLPDSPGSESLWQVVGSGCLPEVSGGTRYPRPKC